MNVLQICANPKPAEESVSLQLSIAFISKLIELCPDVELNNVDLYQDPPPFMTYDAFRGLWVPAFTPTYKPTKTEQAATAYADRQAELFNAADVLVLTMPMWNFSLPAVMKAWVDQILTPGRTFEFDASEGGLHVQKKHKIRRIVALISSGGVYTEGDPRDALTPALRAAFGFIGIEDISIAWADGQTAMIFGDHEERKQTAMEAAVEAAEDLVEDLRDL
jgi:FMN-dependent NADH-azoreductase